jgi:hypothetical protein
VAYLGLHSRGFPQERSGLPVPGLHHVQGRRAVRNGQAPTIANVLVSVILGSDTGFSGIVPLTADTGC